MANEKPLVKAAKNFYVDGMLNASYSGGRFEKGHIGNRFNNFNVTQEMADYFKRSKKNPDRTQDRLWIRQVAKNRLMVVAVQNSTGELLQRPWGLHKGVAVFTSLKMAGCALILYMCVGWWPIFKFIGEHEFSSKDFFTWAVLYTLFGFLGWLYVEMKPIKTMEKFHSWPEGRIEDYTEKVFGES